jgi:5,6-dimethylbenzimidazole synthase
MKEHEHRFSEDERRGVYRAIYERRDVRSSFKPDEIPNDTLARLLDAAHHAPSVGLMQPWGFVVIRAKQVRQTVFEIFDRARHAAAQIYSADRRAMYDKLKLAGILEAPVNLCVTCDESTMRGHGLGRQTMRETAVYSTVCAVQNLWLAARAEGVGVGWVSILDVDQLRAALGIPDLVVPIAYLCLGYVTEFNSEPDLAIKGWEQRVPLASLIHFERYGGANDAYAKALLCSLNAKQQLEDGA